MKSAVNSKIKVRTQKENKNSLFKYGVGMKIAVYAILIVLAVLMLLPVLMIINLSLQSNAFYNENPMAIVPPTQWYFENFSSVLDRIGGFTKVFNSVWMTFTASVVAVLVTVLAAFPISRRYFKGSGGVYLFLLFSMFLPGSLVATVTIVKSIGIYDTPIAVVVLWISGGIQMNMFIINGFVKQLPRELDEAAFIDGCGYFRYVLTIATVLMKPAIATVLVLKIIGCWNDFLTPMIYMVTFDSMRPISTGLYFFKGTFASDWHLYSAAILLISMPMVIIYIFFQRYIIEGMVAGALKG